MQAANAATAHNKSGSVCAFVSLNQAGFGAEYLFLNLLVFCALLFIFLIAVHVWRLEIKQCAR